MSLTALRVGTRFMSSSSQLSRKSLSARQDDILRDFYVVFVNILELEVMVQNAEGPVYLSQTCTINLQLILNFQTLTFKAI